MTERGQRGLHSLVSSILILAVPRTLRQARLGANNRFNIMWRSPPLTTPSRAQLAQPGCNKCCTVVGQSVVLSWPNGSNGGEEGGLCAARVNDGRGNPEAVNAQNSSAAAPHIVSSRTGQDTQTRIVVRPHRTRCTALLINPLSERLGAVVCANRKLSSGTLQVLRCRCRDCQGSRIRVVA